MGLPTFPKNNTVKEKRCKVKPETHHGLQLYVDTLLIGRLRSANGPPILLVVAVRHWSLETVNLPRVPYNTLGYSFT